MKHIVFGISFLIVINLHISGQEQESFSDSDQLEVTSGHVDSDTIKETVNQKKFDTDLTIGTGFAFSPHNFYGPAYYIAPGFSYRVTPRFILSGGVGAEFGRFYPLYDGGNQEDQILPMTRAFLYACGTYLLSSRLSISGVAYKVINDVPRLTQYNPAVNYNYQGIGVGFNYKITESLSVGFEMQIQQNSYYYQSGGLIPPEGYVSIPGF